ncbi:MAG: multidrug efflux pump subunit AcrB [Paracoccaceae bacterium]|jgi:multidrug efflux pump subunit AcrB
MGRDISKTAGGVLSYFTRHGTAANLLLVVLVIGGLLAVPRMKAQFFPDLVIDNISVSVAWRGAGAEDVDNGIVQVLEPALLAVEGVSGVTSASREGAASLRIEFDPNWDMARAATDVQTAVDQVSTLPNDAEDPSIRRGAWRDRVTDVVISGPLDVAQLSLFADELVYRLFTKGVTKATIRGVAAPETVVEIPSINLMSRDISMAQVAAAIAEEVNSDPVGAVSGANARVRTGIEKRSVEEINNIVLRSNSDGSSLKIGDIADVGLRGFDRKIAYFVGNNSAVLIRVDRSQQGDAIDIQDTVQAVVDELAITLPMNTKIVLTNTRAEYITGRLNLLLSNGLMGLAFVVALLFLFLNPKTAFWVAAGIPTSMLAAMGLMYVMGVTINMISLFALILTLGIVVDDAIVVGENADTKARSGMSPIDAAESAARGMFLPVFAATLTTIIAFLGLVAVGGRFGDLILDIPITVSLVLVASFVECFFILPYHMAHSISAVGAQRWYDMPSHYVNRGLDWVKQVLFSPFIFIMIKWRYVVLAGMIALLASQVAMVISEKVQWRFFSAPEVSNITANFVMTDTATRQDTLAMMHELQRATQDLGADYEKRYGTNPMLFSVAQIGGGSGRGLSGTEHKSIDLLGSINIEIIEPDFRPYSSFTLTSELEENVRKNPLLETLSFRWGRSGPGEDSLDVQLYGASAAGLKAAAEDLKAALVPYTAVTAVEDDLAFDKEELILELTPKGQSLGFTIDALGRELRNRLNGIEAATYPVGVRSASIRVELPLKEQTADFLESMQLRSSNESFVPLADIVQVERRSGFSTVRREDGIRLISITGDISEDDPVEAANVAKALAEQILPDIASRHQVEWRLAGLAEQEGAFINDALMGLILCLTGIYLVLTWVFASWTRPLVVMSVIPFGIVGTIFGHDMWNVPMSMFTVVGLLGMTGIIINDSIVLINSIDEKAKSQGLIPSIVEGTTSRLRPVLLTTFTTVLGLLPLLYERSAQAGFLKPTVITLVYGLAFGMVLVLIIVPALMAVQHDFNANFISFRLGIRVRTGRLAQALWAIIALLGLWFSQTLGWAFFSGHMAPWIVALAPTELGKSAMGVAAIVFVVGALAAISLAYVSSFALSFIRMRRS